MKFNKDNTIHFDVNEWSCTDPDCGQFCRIVNKTTFEYIQLKDMCGMEHSQHLLKHLNDRTFSDDWLWDEIDVTEYSDEEIKEYLSPYGEILDGVSDEAGRNQLVAECIFETDWVFS